MTILTNFPNPFFNQEICELECTVSLLTAYEPAASWDDWQARSHSQHS
jgi:hypothetical protein